MSILDGLRVVEVSSTGAAAMAGKQFADWGAYVITLEPVGGSPLREALPWYEAAGRRRSATWEWLSRGKVSLRPSAAEARACCETADVVLLEAEACDWLGLEPGEVRPWLEGRTTCVLISPFATDGPLSAYRATDLGLFARGGWMSTIGEETREPLRPGGELMWRLAGTWAFAAALIALRQRGRGSPPQFVDVSEQAVAAAGLMAPALVRSMNGVDMVRRATRFPMGTLKCADGYVGLSPLTATHWEMVLRMMGLDDLLEGDGTMMTRVQAAPNLNARVEPWLAEHTREEIVEQGQAWGIPAAPVQTVDERLRCPQLKARGFFQTMEVDGRQVKVPRIPYLIAGHGPVDRPPLGERPEMPASPPLPASPPGAGPGGRPFEGVRVIDLTHFWAGPFCTMLLGALGADVIKVEAPLRPDGYRFSTTSPGRPHWWEFGGVWNNTNQDKRAITLDIAAPEGKALLERLVADADIVLSNFANRVMPNLGLTAEHFHTINPRLIVMTLPGYGPGGPWENYVGFGFPFEQVAVCASVTGYADGAPRQMGGFVDPFSGLHAFIATALALRERERSGEGQVIEVPQGEVVDALWGPEYIAVQHGAPVPMRNGNRHAWMAPHNAYRVAGEDNWLTIAVGSDGEFRALANALAQPAWASDPRFATVSARKANEVALDSEISGAVRDCDQLELERKLQAAGVAACRVTYGPRMTEDEGFAHIGFLQELDHPIRGTHPFHTWPMRFSGFDATHRFPSPLLGEHNREVLCGELGLSPEEFAELEAKKITGLWIA